MGREGAGRIDVRVAVDAPEAQELSLLEARNHPKHALLVGNLEARLEAHQVPHLARAILLAQLHDGVGLRAMTPGVSPGILEPHWLHRPEAQHVAAARRSEERRVGKECRLTCRSR